MVLVTVTLVTLEECMNPLGNSKMKGFLNIFGLILDDEGGKSSLICLDAKEVFNWKSEE